VEAELFRDLEFPPPILDVGCGDGHFAKVAMPSPVDVGVDPDARSLREARRRGAYRSLAECTGERLPFEGQTFGSAFSNSVLEHIPNVDRVLAEVARVLRPGAPLAFTVPNPGYLAELSWVRWLGRGGVGGAYAEWFRRMSRVVHLDEEPDWARRLQACGMRLERSFRYFSPRALRTMEWGHYFGAPTLVARFLSGRWIVAPWRASLWLTEALLRRYHDPSPRGDGTFSFYLARKSPSP
jgi:SAM-dependent methyltransferase